MNAQFARAEQFIWHNARLLERRLFDFHFRSGSPQAVVAALCAYQNEDGGFGNALEPDIRCPESQPVPTQHALEILDVVGFDEAIVQRVCDFLLTITTAEGGVPYVLTAVNHYPHAPWWHTEANPPASLNPTATICGLLHKHQVRHPWLEKATTYCWEQIPHAAPADQHEMGCILTFLQYAPPHERAAHEMQRLSHHLLTSGLVAETGTSGYVRKALDWAPFPDAPLRAYFSEQEIQANLAELAAAQQEDGGWGITWPPISPSCEWEWRGWATVGALLRLRANGYWRQ